MTVSATEPLGRPRIASVDLLRGLVIIIMALDHTRDYFSLTPFDPTNPAETTLAYFFTRWITHFCAPVFVFLAGTSAFLYAWQRGASRGALSVFLLTRGLWLVLVEITIVTASWQFAYSVTILQVIWAIGVSMIVLGALIWLPRWLIGALSVLMIAGHNMLDGISAEAMHLPGWLWTILHVFGFIPVSGVPGYAGIIAAYPLVPWMAVMALGYAAAPVFTMDPARRDRLLLTAGAALTLGFFALRGLNIYGDPAPWAVQERGTAMTVASFLNVTKYPPSLLYLLMTLGPALMLMPLLERWRGPVAGFFSVFGKVPFFFYVLHIPLLHAMSRVWQWLSFGAVKGDPFGPGPLPDGYEPSLLRCYLVWIAVIAVLYFPCRWFMGVKKRRKEWWLSYL